MTLIARLPSRLFRENSPSVAGIKATQLVNMAPFTTSSSGKTTKMSRAKPMTWQDWKGDGNLVLRVLQVAPPFKVVHGQCSKWCHNSTLFTSKAKTIMKSEKVHRRADLKMTIRVERKRVPNSGKRNATKRHHTQAT